jgi:hypothetical protein
MKIYLRNFEIEAVAVSLNNVIQRSGSKDGQIIGVNGLTAYKLNKLSKDLGKEAKDWQEHKKTLMDSYVKGGSRKPESKNGKLVFKSEEAEKDFVEVAEAYSEVEVRTLLTEKDLEQLQITGHEMEFLTLIISGDAIRENPEPPSDQTLPEETEEAKELVKAQPVENSTPKPSKVE